MDFTSVVALQLPGGTATGNLLGGIGALIAAATGVYALVLRKRTGEATTKVEELTGDDGTVQALRDEVGQLAEHLVEMSRTTGKQLTAAAETVAACEKRNEEKDQLMESMERRMKLLSRAVLLLHGTIHRIHPDLVAKDPGDLH